MLLRFKDELNKLAKTLYGRGLFLGAKSLKAVELFKERQVDIHDVQFAIFCQQAGQVHIQAVCQALQRA